ncbi:hypothetical protein LCGC14_1276440 [marine sediment metagenome]|uniref:Uncharacterized protein n=1 Tax=marine sediment metagenome TaxID=412755 RepID=A0A0F9KYA6_9ZZZZ
MGQTQPVIRERMILGGPSGSGKTYAMCKIVEGLPNGHHVAIEVDDGFTKLLALEFPNLAATIYDINDKGEWYPREGFAKGDTFRVYHAPSFDAVRSAQISIESLVAQQIAAMYGDFAFIDGLDLIYNTQRYEYISKASSIVRKQKLTIKDEWQAAMETRATGAPILEPADWDVIASFYEKFITYFAFQIPAHLVCATNIEAIDLDSRYVSKEAKELAKSIGIPLKFEGQKRTPRLFDTLLGMAHTTAGFNLTIYKDRGGLGRAWSQGKENTSYMTYECADFFKTGQELFGWQV